MNQQEREEGHKALNNKTKPTNQPTKKITCLHSSFCDAFIKIFILGVN